MDVLAELVAEIGPLWDAQRQAELLTRPRRRRIGAGARHKLVFVDRLLATLIHLRHGVTHDVLGCWFGVDCSTITRAIGYPRHRSDPPAAGSARMPHRSRPQAHHFGRSDRLPG
ncbi:transposase family protein [Nonomuraea sp. NPDC050691]|uniref:helix-turn-helix domain-containing protein n=1 Tax=Nonomuraea sp. NPDC050691 TaxID=3155661 RepID=UPI00340DC9B7